MTTEAKIRLLVCDDHEVIRYGVKALLAGTDIKVVAEACTGQGAIKVLGPVVGDLRFGFDLSMAISSATTAT